MAEHQAHNHDRAVRWHPLLAVLVLCVGMAGALAAPVGATMARRPWPVPPSQAVRCDWSSDIYDEFYTVPALPTPIAAGDVLRVEHIRSYTATQLASIADLESTPYGAEVYRILYASEAPRGTRQIVSGMMLAPSGSAPAGGFPVIAYGHGTTGSNDNAAPSRRTFSVPSLLPWVANGFVVSASDYVGLGMPGPHPYLVGEAAAWSVLDSARAATRFCDTAHGIGRSRADDRVIVMGHSQGGHAALFATEEAAGYAPELDVLGTVAFAPASELRELVAGWTETTAATVTPGVMAMYAFSQYYGAPPTTQSWLNEPYATQLPQRIESMDLVGLTLWLGFKPDRVFDATLLGRVRARQWNALAPWTAYLDRNTPGNVAVDTPILLVQGLRDIIVPPDLSERLLTRLCANGTRAALSLYPDAGHDVDADGYAEALAWTKARLRQMPAATSCQTQLYLPAINR